MADYPYPVPASKPMAPTLPSGYRVSAWPWLDPHARAMFLQEMLSAGGDRLAVTGGVDYESPLEPVLFDRQTGGYVSLAGDAVTLGAEPPVIGIFGGRASELWPIVVGLIGAAALILWK